MKGVWFNNLVNRELHPHAQFRGHSFGVESLCFLPDAWQLVSGSHDKTVRLWDMETGSCLRVATPLAQGVWSLDHDSQKRIVCTDSDGSVALTDFRTDKDCVAQREKVGDRGLFVQAVGLRDTFLLGGNSQLLMLNERLQTVASFASEGEAFFAAREAQGTFYTCTSRGRIRAFDALLHEQSAAQLCEGELRAMELVGQSLYCSPEPGLLAVFGLQDGKFARQSSFLAHTDRINCIAASSSGELLVTGSKDGTALAWRLGQVEFARSLVGSKDQVTCARISSDNQLIALSTWDPNILIYKTDKLDSA